MSKAQTDIRTTSYDSATANAVGYQGTIDDALAQIRAEADRSLPRAGNERRELLRFLGVRQRTRPISGLETNSLDTFHARSGLFETEADDSVVYGALEPPKQPWDAFSPYSLEYAMARWPQNFVRSQSDGEVNGR